MHKQILTIKDKYEKNALDNPIVAAKKELKYLLATYVLINMRLIITKHLSIKNKRL